MNEIKPQPLLIRKNEIVLKESDKWLHFARPFRLIEAERLDEVLPTLREVERLVELHEWHAAGFLSYDAAPAFDPALRTHASSTHHDQSSTRPAGFPYLWFGLYPRPRVVTLPEPGQTQNVLSWQPTIDRQTYNDSIRKIKEYIAGGRTYQVNYTMRLQTDFTGNAWDFFLQLTGEQNSQAAYLDTGRYVICSASPELFFQLDGDMITCRPMKGTTRRGRTTQEDLEQAAWLEQSAKNRAENVMIVDMIRNDLGRIAEIGSVHVPQLFKTERYPTLWQMTSTVTARTKKSVTEILTALFPCASVTGAPKVSTMNIIAELENTPRRIYTGSIGYIAPRRRAKFSVAIRTVLIDRETQNAEYGVGGGIVWDSTSSDEYNEALLKARLLQEQRVHFSLLETLLWTPEEGFVLREKHLTRMLESAAYFDIPIRKEKLEEFFERLSSSFVITQRVRILLDQTGQLDFDSAPFEPDEHSGILKACLAERPVSSQDIFLFHKTTQRTVYETARKGCGKFDDVLLYNEFGELTEFTIGNLVVELGGQLLTPPISCGVLAGTFRSHLLETGQVAEGSIPVERLRDCTAIFRVNSVRRWQRVQIQRNPVLGLQ